ncbi:Xyloglucan O-acetyltransferase [Dirofilaria immitis]
MNAVLEPLLVSFILFHTYMYAFYKDKWPTQYKNKVTDINYALEADTFVYFAKLMLSQVPRNTICPIIIIQFKILM